MILTMVNQVVNERAFIKRIKKEMEIGLPPQCIGTEFSALNQILKKKRYQYCPELNGVLINASGMQFVEETGRIIDDGPLIYWKITANLQVFHIDQGALVRCEVTNIGKQYLNTLLVGCIDVTIRFEEQHQELIETSLLPQLTVGEEIIFKVVTFMPAHKYIDGLIDTEVLQHLQLL